MVLVGQNKALGIAVRNDRPQWGYSGLLARLRGDRRRGSIGGSIPTASRTIAAQGAWVTKSRQGYKAMS